MDESSACDDEICARDNSMDVSDDDYSSERQELTSCTPSDDELGLELAEIQVRTTIRFVTAEDWFEGQVMQKHEKINQSSLKCKTCAEYLNLQTFMKLM